MTFKIKRNKMFNKKLNNKIKNNQNIIKICKIQYFKKENRKLKSPYKK